MGCLHSVAVDNQSLLRSELPVQYEDKLYGPIYMNFELSRHIRNSCGGKSRSFVRHFMRSYPQLSYEIGNKSLILDRKIRSPNNLRFCFDDLEDRVIVVLNG